MKTRYIYRLLFLIASVFMAQSVMHAHQPVTEADDGYHFKYWEGSPYNAAYNEWWYFNLCDKTKGIQAIFTYQVADPLDLTGEGVGDLTSVVYQGKNIITESDLYPLSAFTASYSAADVTLGPNTISVDDPNTYHVAGSSQDGRLSWNLYSRREGASWFAGDRINVQSLAWEQMSWLLYMPRARVFGSLTVDGQTYDIDCSGYHDHNWGQWNFETLIWNWAQYSQPNLTFDLGDFVGNPNGRARIDVDGIPIVFSASQYKLVHTKWGYDPQNNLPYPTQSIFTAQNEDVSVQITMDVSETDPLATGPPPSLVIYEQTSHFTGTITKKGGEEREKGGEEREKTYFEGDGFKEYTEISSATP